MVLVEDNTSGSGIAMLKYPFYKEILLWIRDVKGYITTRKYGGFSNDSSSSHHKYEERRKEKIVTIFLTISSFLLALAGFLSRKYKDSIIDTIFIIALILQITAISLLIIKTGNNNTLKGGERCIHRIIFLF